MTSGSRVGSASRARERGRAKSTPCSVPATPGAAPSRVARPKIVGDRRRGCRQSGDAAASAPQPRTRRSRSSVPAASSAPPLRQRRQADRDRSPAAARRERPQIGPTRRRRGVARRGVFTSLVDLTFWGLHSFALPSRADAAANGGGRRGPNPNCAGMKRRQDTGPGLMDWKGATVGRVSTQGLRPPPTHPDLAGVAQTNHAPSAGPSRPSASGRAAASRIARSSASRLRG